MADRLHGRQAGQQKPVAHLLSVVSWNITSPPWRATASSTHSASMSTLWQKPTKLMRREGSTPLVAAT
jgi:hypothetical protein